MLIRVANHRKRHAEAFREFPGLRLGPHAHQHDGAARLTDILLGVAQLRHLLAAERSAQVPQKNEDQPLLLPEGAQVPA